MQIYTNTSSLLAQQHLRSSTGALSTSIERLSSGLRINSAKDDAAGLAIANRMTSQIRGYGQAQRNSMDALSLAQTAEAGVSGMNDALQRVRELVVQAGNGTMVEENLQTIQSEIDSNLAHIEAISRDSIFNGIGLLNESRTLSMQVGPNGTQADTFPFSLKALNLETLGLDNGLFPFRVIEDGNPLPLGPPLQSIVAGTADNAGAYKLQINGVTHWNTVLNLDEAAAYYGTTPQEVTIHRVIDPISGDEVQGYVIAKFGEHYMIEEDSSLQLDFAAGTATLVITSHQRSTYIDPDNGVVSATIVTDPTIIAKSGMTADGKVVLYYEFQDKTFARDGTPFKLSGPGANAIQILRRTPVTDEPLKKIDAALSKLNDYRGYLAAVQNRLSAIMAGSGNAVVALSQARSRIEDADYASEIAAMTRSQILQQAATALLAQANQFPRQVLSLLS